MNRIIQVVCAMVLTTAFANVANALDWKNDTYNGVVNTSTVQTIGGYYYRIRLDGRILQRESGSRTYRFVTLHDVPAAARTHVARRYDAFVPPIERDYDLEVTRSYSSTTTTTDDHSNRSRTSDDHSSRTQEYRFEGYRDRDVDYTAHTRGTNAPVVIANDNYRSTITVNVHPVDATMAMAIAAQNNQLTQQIIAAEGARAQAEAELRIERSRPPQVQIVQVETRTPHCQQPYQRQCQKVQLCAKDWRCGSHFRDQHGRQWNRVSGPPMTHYPRRIRGTYGRDARGMLTITVCWSGGTTVFVDP